MKQFLHRWILPRIVARSCESRIPRSGKRGEAVNCFVVAIDRDGERHFVATSCTEDSLVGLKWVDSSFSEKTSIPFEDIDDRELNITHYYGLSEVTFDGIYDLTWSYFTKLVYLRIGVYRYLDATHQYLFNKKKLVAKRRMDLLSFMVNDQLDRTHDGIDQISLMTKIYSMRLFLHPNWDVENKKVRLYLDSLVESGDLLLVNNHEYVVFGQALSTLEKYEEEERRHTESVKLQHRMFWIAVIALVFAVVQTGLIKLPTIMDLTQ